MIRSLSTILLLLIPCFESFRFHSQELRRHHLLRLTPSEQYVKSPTHSSSSRLSMSALSTFASISTVASVIAFHEAGHLLAAKSQKMKVQSYNVGYGPKLFSFNDSTDTEYALRLIPLGGYVAFPSNVEYNEEGEVVQEFDDPDLLQNRPPLQRALVISAGVVANVLLTFLLSTGVAFTSGISHPTFNNGVIVITNPDPSSPAFAAGITKGDLIVKLDNQVILGSDKAIENFVKKIGESADRTLTLQINRNDKIIDTSVVPHSSSSGGNKAKIGIGIANNLAEVGRVRAANILDASVQGAQETKRLIDATVAGIQRFFGDVQMDQMGGPISVIKAGAEIGEFSLSGLLGFAAVLSINLAVLNSLPIPALDGGQLVLVLIEFFTGGGGLPKKAVEGVTRLGFSLMLALGLTTFVGDISKLGQRAILPSEIVDSMNAPKQPTLSDGEK